MCGVTMRDRYPCEELQARVGVKPIVDGMRQRRLCWFGHIEKREDNSWLKKVQILAVDGHSGRGRPIMFPPCYLELNDAVFSAFYRGKL